MEPESLLPHTNVPTTCPYPEPARSSSYPISHFLKIHLNIILPSTPGSPKWSFSLRFPQQSPVYTSPLIHPRYMPRPSNSSQFYRLTIYGEQYRSLSSSLCSFPHPPVTSSLLGPSILLSTLFSNTSAYVPPSMCATKFHTHTEQQAKLQFCIS